MPCTLLCSRHRARASGSEVLQVVAGRRGACVQPARKAGCRVQVITRHRVHIRTTGWRRLPGAASTPSPTPAHSAAALWCAACASATWASCCAAAAASRAACSRCAAASIAAWAAAALPSATASFSFASSSLRACSWLVLQQGKHAHEASGTQLGAWPGAERARSPRPPGQRWPPALSALSHRARSLCSPYARTATTPRCTPPSAAAAFSPAAPPPVRERQSSPLVQPLQVPHIFGQLAAASCAAVRHPLALHRIGRAVRGRGRSVFLTHGRAGQAPCKPRAGGTCCTGCAVPPPPPPPCHHKHGEGMGPTFVPSHPAGPTSPCPSVPPSVPRLSPSQPPLRLLYPSPSAAHPRCGRPSSPAPPDTACAHALPPPSPAWTWIEDSTGWTIQVELYRLVQVGLYRLGTGACVCTAEPSSQESAWIIVKVGSRAGGTATRASALARAARATHLPLRLL